MNEPMPVRRLTFGEAIRTRPGMYIGNQGPEALQHLIDELMSNAIDQFLMGRATFVDVRVHDDGGIEVADDGAGLPFDEPATDDSASLATHWFTTPHHTARADDHAPHIHVHSLFGIGLPSANHCSHRLVCRSWRNGALWEQSFTDGVPDAPPHVTANGNGRGTRITFWPDAAIVGAATPARGPLRATLQRAAHLFAGLELRYDGETFHARDGLGDLLYLLHDLGGRRHARWDNRPVFRWHGRHGDFQIEAAAVGFAGDPHDECLWHTWVNGRATTDHGSHRLGFAHVLRREGWMPAIVALHVITHDPRFAGPTHNKYNFPPARTAVREALARPLNAFCREHQIGCDAVNDDRR